VIRALRGHAKTPPDGALLCAVTSSGESGDTALASQLAIQLALITGTPERPSALIDLSEPTGLSSRDAGVSPVPGAGGDQRADNDDVSGDIDDTRDEVYTANTDAPMVRRPLPPALAGSTDGAVELFVPTDQALLSDQMLAGAIEQLSRKYGYVVVNAPGADDLSPAARFLSAVDGVVLTTRLHRSSRRAAQSVLDVLQRLRDGGVFLVALDRSDSLVPSGKPDTGQS
jgi:hypothetical protein